jgi:predicted AlkP superfamily phosphohydrolase/phosphomutase
MHKPRVLVIGLDGYDLSLAKGLMDEGLLPNLRRLGDHSARFLLDQGRDRATGLTWEQVSTGQTAAAIGRWSAVTFEPASYHVKQEPTLSVPFLADLAAETVVFDMPYCDLSRAPRLRGLTRWGAHSPSVTRLARPDGLHAEIAQRFGPYPAADHHHALVWQSPEKSRIAAAALEKSVGVRANISRWLLGERIPDWDLGLVVVSEAHSAIEAFWHGVDAGHPLHGVPSAAVARDGLRRIYGAIDDLLGVLLLAFPDALPVLFSMHGMGPNDADVAGMVLLSELLYRHSFGKAYLKEREWRAYTAEGVPLLAEDQDWQAELVAAVPWVPWGRKLDQAAGARGVSASLPRCNLEWMPAARYRHHWPRMTAFALPPFADGRVRINLQGREAQGLVPREQYTSVRNEIVGLLHACREPIRGESVVTEVYHPDKDPYEIGPTEADLTITWRGAPLGLVHPQLGRIGPLPYRRPGGHTGGWGFAYVAGPQLAPGDHGKANSFDVVPTIIDLLHEPRPARVCGQSLLGRCRDAGNADTAADGPAGANA